MEFNVHRLRFGDWQPRSIRAIAPDPYSSKVAIGREDGDVEIRDSSNKWYTQVVAPGSSDFKLQALCWSTVYSERGRLFGVSLRGFIFELDLSTLSLKTVRDAYGGAAWCMAANPRNASLAVGCEDGGVRLFNYDGGVGALEFMRALPTTGARVLCVAYHPVKERLFIGCDDGTIRCVDETTGRSIYRMTGDVLRGVATYIWSIAVLSDSTVVTGDSRGHVQLWDGETGVLMVTIHQHTADVLALAVSPDESQVFASGVDSRVTCITKVGNSTTSSSSSSSHMSMTTAAATSETSTFQDESGPSESNPTDGHWVYTTSHRPHSHDIFALAVVCPGGSLSPTSSSSSLSMPTSSSSSTSTSSGNAGTTGAGLRSRVKDAVLVSGGLDTKLCVYSIEEFARHRPTWLLPLPATGLLLATADNSLHALRHRNKIELWTVDFDTDTNDSHATTSSSSSARHRAQTESDAEDDEDDDEESGRRALAQAQAASTGEDSACRLALRLQTKGEDNLHCIALAANGSALACSSARTGTRVWSLARETPDSVPSRDQDDYDNNNTKRMAKKGGKGKKQEAILIAPKLANELKVQRLKLPALAEGFCQSLVFSDDGKRLAAYTAKGLLLLMAVGEGATDGDDDADASEGPADKEDEEEEEEGAAATNGELNEDDDEDDNENDDEEKVEAEGDGDDDIEESDGDVDDEDEEEDDDDSDNDNDSDGVPSKKQRRSRPNTTTSSTSSTSTSRTTSSGVQLRHVFDHRSQVESLSLKSNKASAKSKNNSGSSSSSNNSSAWSGLESAVTKLCFSPDGMYLAVADADRTVYTYDIDRLRLHWRLPKCSAPVTAIAFDPHCPSTLVVTTADNVFALYDISDMTAAPWTQRNHSRLPLALRDTAGPILGIAFDPTTTTNDRATNTATATTATSANKEVNATAKQNATGKTKLTSSNSSSSGVLILYGHGFLVYVDLSMEIPLHPKIIQATGTGTPSSTTSMLVVGSNNNSRSLAMAMKNKSIQMRNSRRNKQGGGRENSVDNTDAESNFAIIQKYRSLLHVGCLSNSQLVLVENPWVRILEQLPDTLHRKRYGT